MKHLKIFEDFSSDKYYREINHAEFAFLKWGSLSGYENPRGYHGNPIHRVHPDIQKMDISYEMFTESEKEYLSHLGYEGNEFEIRLDMTDPYFFEMAVVGIESKSYVYFSIKKFKDDWFLVNFGSESYLCDQFDGVKKLIKDKVLS